MCDYESNDSSEQESDHDDDSSEAEDDFFDQDDDLRVYVYRGTDGEKVPRSVKKLIVDDGVQEVPDSLCMKFWHLQEVTLPNGLTRIGQYAFYYCIKLSKVNRIPNSVQVIGKWAFRYCEKLKKIEFEDRNGTLPPQLKMIERQAFESHKLQTINLPPSVSALAKKAFNAGMYLTEANLSRTCITEIPKFALAYCSLQTVSLPNTLKGICRNALSYCYELVTVIVPLDSQPIRIEDFAFCDCKKLANIVLPKGSTASEDEYDKPFQTCMLLRAQFSDETTSVVAGLISRFDGYPIHRLCYDHSAVTVQELRQCIADRQEGNPLTDEFGMSSLHVFFSTFEPRGELLDVLLESLPKRVLNCKDANNKRPLDYLVTNWTNGNAALFEMTVQQWMIDPLSRWGAVSWRESMQSKVQEILAEPGKKQRAALNDGLLADFERFTNVEVASVLELAVWKVKLGSGRGNGSSKRGQALDREASRCISGSNVVVPKVLKFLGIARNSCWNDGLE